MNHLQIVQLNSIGELRAAAAVWDDLWWRSDVTIPTYRAELVAQWIEHFAPDADFHALVVQDGRDWVAVLPLVRRKSGRVLNAGTLPLNEWVSRGELLLDPDADVDAVLDTWLAAATRLPLHLLRFDEVALDAPYWRAFQRAVSRAAMAADFRPQYPVAWIETDHDWEACRKRWSRKHRQAMSRALRRLAKQGEPSFTSLSELAPDDVEAWMRSGFDIEDRSWKGRAGTSVMRTRGMFEFFTRQAVQLAAWGQLDLHFLESRGRPVAFAYGMNAKGVYHSCKIGYDPEYAFCKPGQLLRYRMLEAFHADPDRRAIDCIGPMTEAHRSWRPATHAVGRVVVAPRSVLGRLAVLAYRCLGSRAAEPAATVESSGVSTSRCGEISHAGETDA